MTARDGGQDGADTTGPYSPQTTKLLHLVDLVLHPQGPTDPERCQREALERLSIELGPLHIQAEERRAFVTAALLTKIVERAADLVEGGSVDVAVTACNFLGDFAFSSDAGARAALQAFDKVASRFATLFQHLSWEYMPLLEAAVLFCVNVAAMRPSCHPRLLPLVRPVCLQIIRTARASSVLKKDTILLLANLSMTVGDDLRSLGVAEALLDMVLSVRDPQQLSVAESVIVFLHGDRKCDVIDKLMEFDVVRYYCVPIMESSMQGKMFRGMCPHLMYSARLFQVLAQCTEYAEALVQDERVVPLLLEAQRDQDSPVRLETDVEGRLFALEALRSLLRLGLWGPGEAFLSGDLPLLLADEHAGIRTVAAEIWALLHRAEVHALFLLGARLHARGRLPCRLWQQKVLSFTMPHLARE